MRSLCLPRRLLQPDKRQSCLGRYGNKCSYQPLMLTACGVQTEMSRTWSRLDHAAAACGAKSASAASCVSPSVIGAPGTVC
jgi:hypothetical protein